MKGGAHLRLGELIRGLDITRLAADPDMPVTGLHADYRQIEPGDVFIAVRGLEADGHSFIPLAIEAGASAVIAEERVDGAAFVETPDTRKAMALAAANFYGNPAGELRLIGVTGTNGKTTTTNLIKQLLESATGQKVGLIGTNRDMIGKEEIRARRTTPTTPDSIELHALLRRMADEGCRYVVMEVSSHALALDRVYGLRFFQGIFTNLTQDHLDFHKTMEEYAAAKAKLFAASDVSIVNLDDPWARVMTDAAAGRVYTYSASSDLADLTAKNIRLHASNVSFCALMTGKIEKLRLAIPGMFSVYNALAATASAVNAGVGLEEVRDAMSGCTGVRGRVEVVPTGTDFTVIIDYAHSPDALEKVLTTLRASTKGRLIALFGCGGDRDRTKRPAMGRLASTLADYVVVTSDNPRTEDPDAIISEIVAGMERDGAPFAVLPDRREAIAHALSVAGAGDTVLLLGKGHEDYQIIGREKRPFDERQVVAEVLGRLGGAQIQEKVQ